MPPLPVLPSQALPRVGVEMRAHLYYRRTLSLLHGDASHHLERLAEAVSAPDSRT